MQLNGRKNTTVSLADLPTASPSGVPAWMQQMREAAHAQVTQADVEAIVAKQVERAKNGDASAIKFVFEQVLGGAAFRGATIIQNHTENHFASGAGSPDQLDPKKPIKQGLTVDQRLEVTTRRLALGLPLTNPCDSKDLDLD